MNLSQYVSDPELLRTALTHSSYAHEREHVAFNERLEFLGDAVVQLAVTDWLYRRHPDWSEGQLSEARASVVRESALAEAARRLRLGEALYVGRGEERTGGRQKSSLLADAFEAVVGAAYLSNGLVAASQLVGEALATPLASVEHLHRDFKTVLAEQVIPTGDVPRYHVVAETGPEHEKHFTVAVVWGDRERGRGGGRSKKEAEQAAAAAALRATNPKPPR